MRQQNRDNVNELVDRVNERGRLVLDLSRVVEDEIDRLRGRERGQTETESGVEEQRRLPRSQYGVDGYGKKPSRYYDQDRITEERYNEILNNPPEYVEFVYQNRRFKLVPIGTIEPVAKDIYMSRTGSLYYWKTRDSAGNRLPMSKWTKIYLKRNQRQQCLFGGSSRTQGMGLAGLLPGNEVCLNQPDQPRRTAARPPRRQEQQERQRRQMDSSSSGNSSSSSRSGNSSSSRSGSRSTNQSSESSD